MVMRPDIVAALDAAHPRDIRADWGLRPIINVSGTMTVFGASIMVPQAVAAMAAIAAEFVELRQRDFAVGGGVHYRAALAGDRTPSRDRRIAP
jgi:seryl-tRNA(Sec) selenium transferase